MGKIATKKPTEKTVAKPTITENTINNNQAQEILDLVKQLKLENAELKSKMDEKESKKKKEKEYKGPRTYSYKLWNDVPILDYTTVKKDPTKDLQYKNHMGVYVNNQDLKLELADGKIIQVDILDFGRDYKMSTKMNCEVLSDGFNITGYKFKNSKYGEFIILPKVIN